MSTRFSISVTTGRSWLIDWITQDELILFFLFTFFFSMNKKLWLKIAAGLSFFMAICHTGISLSPATAAYFGAPPPLLENRIHLFLIGEAAALIFAIFGLYALSGAGSIRHLPLLRLGLSGISSLYLLRGLFFILTVLTISVQD
jgi:hypothetical protein